MPVNFTHDVQNNIVYTEVSGIFTTSELLDYVNGVSESESIGSGFVEVVRLNADDMILKFSDVERIISQISGWEKKNHSFTLMCTFTDKSKALASMLMPLFQKVSTKVTVMICSSELELKKNLKNILSAQ